MNNKIDEVYIALLKAKQNIADYIKNKVTNEDCICFYNGINERIDNIINDYAITTHLSSEEIYNCLLEIGADNKDSIFHEELESIKFNDLGL